jgi:cytochrome P450
MQLPPGPRHLSEILKIVGQRMKDPIELYKNIFQKYGPIVYFKVGSNQFAMLSDADAAEHVLHSDAKNFTKSILYERFKLILGNGLLVSEGELWKKQRRLVGWAFSSKNIEKVHPVMVQECLEMVERWKSKKNIDLAQEMNLITLQVISVSLFGQSQITQAESVRGAIKDMLAYLQTTRFLTIMFFLSLFPFKEKHKIALKIESWLPLRDTRRFFKAIKTINKLVTAMIDERKQLNKNENLLDAMINATDSEDQSQMTTTQLKDEAVTIFIAGHETTATALTWTWHMLLKHPDIIMKARDEVDAQISDTPTFQEIQGLTYLKAVFEESMRLYPPFWRVSRKTAKPLKIKNFDIPLGTNIVTSIFNLHRDPLHWDEPLAFKPERFINRKKDEQHRFAYLPFGAGPRACIGAQFAMIEALTVLSIAIKNFDFQKQFTEDPEIFASLTIHPKQGCPVAVIKRERT